MVNNDLINFGLNLALSAGEIMKKYFSLDLEFELKSDITPITIADKEINSMVIDRIINKYPAHSILGEEESFIKDSEYTWVCDPIDGTNPYTWNLPISMFSLALVHNGNPIFGVTYNPFVNHLYYGVLNGKSYLNNCEIKVSNKEYIPRRNFVCFDGIKNTDKFNSGIVIKELVDQEFMIPRLYCLVASCSLLARGIIDGAIMNLNTAHDFAAIKVIIESAGGIVTDFNGNNQRYDQPVNGVIASNGKIHDKLLNIVNLGKI